MSGVCAVCRSDVKSLHDVLLLLPMLLLLLLLLLHVCSTPSFVHRLIISTSIGDVLTAGMADSKTLNAKTLVARDVQRDVLPRWACGGAQC